jgi:hypothetical protein
LVREEPWLTRHVRVGELECASADPAAAEPIRVTMKLVESGSAIAPPS